MAERVVGEMKLVASVICRNERGRYLEPFIDHLLEFVDEIRLLDDSSEDGTLGWLAGQWTRARVFVATTQEPTFFVHEGNARNQLLNWTMQGEPTHILAIDADEFVSDGKLLRQELEMPSDRTVWNLCIEEVWQADADGYKVRCDGNWVPHGITFAYKVPDVIDPRFWKLQDSKLACGRVPLHVHRVQRHRKVRLVDASVLHVGWACEADRAKRHARYVEHDGGAFHHSQHLDSIMWQDARVGTESRPWPESLKALAPRIAARAQQSL